MTEKQIALARQMIIGGAKWADVSKKLKKPAGLIARKAGTKKAILASVKVKKTKKAA